MCYTKIFQSCPFACRNQLLSKQTIVGGQNR
nr:MAG TPA: Telomere repeats-binding bouquet formation protein [Caudoviricetes sp.]